MKTECLKSFLVGSGKQAETSLWSGVVHLSRKKARQTRVNNWHMRKCFKPHSQKQQNFPFLMYWNWTCSISAIAQCLFCIARKTHHKAATPKAAKPKAETPKRSEPQGVLTRWNTQSCNTHSWNTQIFVTALKGYNTQSSEPQGGHTLPWSIGVSNPLWSLKIIKT